MTVKDGTGKLKQMEFYQQELADNFMLLITKEAGENKQVIEQVVFNESFVEFALDLSKLMGLT